MPALSQVLNKLQRERSRMQQQLQRVEADISALRGLSGRSGKTASSDRPRRILSVSARRRIAAAQRARWAKVRAQKKEA